MCGALRFYADEEMKAVAEAIAFAQEALEPSTLKTYNSHKNGFNAWAASQGLPLLSTATQPIHIVRYLKFLSDTGAAAATFKSVREGLAHHFRHLNYNPTAQQIVTDAVKSGYKKGRPTKHREPLTREILLRLSVACHTHKLSAVRDFFAILLAFRGFLRGGEVMDLYAEDLLLQDLKKDESRLPALPPLAPSAAAPPPAPAPAAYVAPRSILIVFISSSKTNSQGQRPRGERRGETVIVGPDRDQRLCPISWYHRYMAMRKSALGGDYG